MHNGIAGPMTHWSEFSARNSTESKDVSPSCPPAITVSVSPVDPNLTVPQLLQTLRYVNCGPCSNKNWIMSNFKVVFNGRLLKSILPPITIASVWLLRTRQRSVKGFGRLGPSWDSNWKSPFFWTYSVESLYRMTDWSNHSM